MIFFALVLTEEKEARAGDMRLKWNYNRANQHSRNVVDLENADVVKL